MTLNSGVTDEQLGRFYRKIKAIGERIGKSLSFDEVMQELQLIHDGKMRNASGMPEDLRQFFQRPFSKAETIQVIGGVGISEVTEKDSDSLFQNKKRFEFINHVEYLTLPGKHPGQKAGKITIYRVRGMQNSKTMAAELLKVNDETPASWIKELLITRGHAFTLPAIEMLVETQTSGVELGLNRCKKLGDPCDRPGNLAFVEVFPGRVELIRFSRETQKGWRVALIPFDEGGQTNRDQDYLITRN